MKTEVRDVSPTQKELRIEIDTESLRESYARVSQKYAKRANVPGFRKGFAPVDVVRIRFKEEIRSDVLQDVVPTKVSEAIREHDLHPLAEPHLHIDDAENVSVNGSVPLSLHVHVEVMPEIANPEYKGIEVVRRLKPVTDSEVEDLIAERLQREAALIPVEGRPSEEGDTIIVDLEGRFDGQPDAEPVVANDLEVVLGDEVIEKSFTENLLGLREDDDKEFTVAYPESFSSEALAGKTVHYKAKVKSVGRSELPELNDDWATSLDEGYLSLADLRSRLKADLEKLAEADADARVRNNVIHKLVESNSFEVPNTLIENQARRLLNDFARDLQQRGADLSKVANDFVQMAYSNMRSQAERDVRGAMLLDRVAVMEGIEVGDAELDDEVTKMAEYYGVSPDEVRSSLTQDDGLESIWNNLKTRKAIEVVVSHAKVTAGEWIEESQADAAEEPKAKKKTGKAAGSGKKAGKAQ